MKKAILPLFLVLLVVCGLGGYAYRTMAAAKAGEAAKTASKNQMTVAKGDLLVQIVETGTVDAVKSVEVKGLVTGRLSKLFVDEGDHVTQGQLIALIDPKETRLLLQQNQAQLMGARSGAEKTVISIQETRLQVKAAYEQAKAKVAQMELALKIQPSLTSNAITQARMNLETAQDEKRRLLDSAQPTQMAAAKSALDEAKASLANAKLDYDRQVELETKGYVSGKVVENADLALALAKTRLDSAQISFDKLSAEFRAELTKAEEAIKQSQASLDIAKANSIQDEVKRHDYLSALADLERAKASLRDPEVMEKTHQQDLATVSQLESVVGDAERQLSETDIRAPISGIVTKKSLQVGELATGLSQFSSGTTIVKIEDRTAMRVKLDVNEIDVAKMTVGMPAKVDVDAIPNHTFTGTVNKIAPASKDSSSGTTTATSTDSVVKYEVEILLKDATPNLRSGMSAKCTMEVVNHHDVVTLPLEYVGKDGKKSFVEIPSKDPKTPAKRQYIVVGPSSGSAVEVLSGVGVGTSIQKPKYQGPARKGAMQFGNDDQ
ncbi:MAG: HlyD family efflux transporter periplasmic adaptor subunit [Fimbriimonas sp.]|nr:HlyD family efflux transporter periplasmic adaptor subunit [Fimbriimonas sp.]